MNTATPNFYLTAKSMLAMLGHSTKDELKDLRDYLNAVSTDLDNSEADRNNAKVLSKLVNLNLEESRRAYREFLAK